jgi:hypothetical protein
VGDLSFGRNYGIKCVEHSLWRSLVLNVQRGVPTGVGLLYSVARRLSFDVSQAA